MHIVVLTLKLHAAWVHSLKEKRMEVKSLLARIRNTFNVSAVEAAEQDVHQIIVLCVAGIAANTAQADSIADNILRFVENNTDAELIGVESELC